jgi:hypothetical protein
MGMANISKAERRAQALERRAKREASRDEVMEARLRTGIGFAVAYVGTQILPRFAPTLAANQMVVDLALAGGGGYFALTDDSEVGDFATGVALVGLTQTLDRAVTSIEGWLDN